MNLLEPTGQNEGFNVRWWQLNDSWWFV